jgi:hypothetical protein
MHSIGRHTDWLIEGTVFLIVGLVSLLFTVEFGFFHAFLHMVYPVIPSKKVIIVEILSVFFRLLLLLVAWST